MSFTCVKIEGGLLSADILEQIAAGEALAQQPKDFGLEKNVRLSDEIARAWSDARAFWEAFQRLLQRLPENDPATSDTRERWMVPLLRVLEYELTYVPRAAVVDGRTYAISHRAGEGEDEEAPAVHIVGCRADLDRRSPTGRPRLSPHSLVQEYLNRTEHLWGIVANGYRLRLLRDSQRTARPTYIEFDLQQIMEGEQFADFALLYRLVHRTRLPRSTGDAPECLLEQYHQQAIEQGSRIRDRLRDSVEEALQILGNGFLQYPRNEELRELFRGGELSAKDYYCQLLYLIYRLLFLMVAEERKLLSDNRVYREHYSITRLRRLAESRLYAPRRHGDLWLGLQQIFRLFQQEKFGAHLDIPPLNGELFSSLRTNALEDVRLANVDLLHAIRFLSLYRDEEAHTLRRVNYTALDVEELGSVYESLLEYHPVVREDHGRFVFELAFGSERKSTGSYYTRPELVHELVKSALEPVLAERLAQAQTPEGKERAILSLKVCDPASGSGHFLLAAARRLGRELARVRSGEEEPPPEQFREAVRDVIAHCIYAVDLNPLAVDLCKVALWIEGHTTGKPLTFLDHRVKCGNSLIGVLDLGVLQEGIPDGAFKPVSGDDKEVAKLLKQQNRRERREWEAGQLTLGMDLRQDLGTFADRVHQLEQLRDDRPEQVDEKARIYQEFRSPGTSWQRDWTACNLWTAAFFSELKEENQAKIPTTGALRDFLERRIAPGQVIGLANALAGKHPFFHWPLEFPEVFAQGGFDVILSNPPWERIKLQEREFFATRDPEIANAPNKAAREKLIKELPQKNPPLAQEYAEAKHAAEALSKFLRESTRFPLTARGDINTYAVFAELGRNLINDRGRAGMVLPTGIATDGTNKLFFAELVDNRRLASLFDFENREGLFPDVDSRYKFSLVTMRGSGDRDRGPAALAFFSTRVEHLKDERRRFTLSDEDFRRLNPNTRTCPVFRTKADAELTKKIYRRVPVLVNEAEENNPWGIHFNTMFHMSNDSHLFCMREELEQEGFRLVGNRFVKADEVWLPLYEAKMIHQFDHRFGTFEGLIQRPQNAPVPSPTCEQYQNPDFAAQPWYWVTQQNVMSNLEKWHFKWFLGFRAIARTTDERTFIASAIPLSALGNSIIVSICEHNQVPYLACFLADLASFAFDYVVRQKIGGINMNMFFIKQLPALPPSAYTSNDLLFIVPRMLELVYTAWDIKPFADDAWREASSELREAIRRQWEESAAATGSHNWNLPARIEACPEIRIPSPSSSPSPLAGEGRGIPFPPFKWDEARRARLRAELDAYYARLYGLTRKQLRYILDPADLTEKELEDLLDPWEEVRDPLDLEGYAQRVAKSDFPGETFRVLKEKEVRQYGEYRTRRLVLEAWEQLKEETLLRPPEKHFVKGGQENAL